MNSFEKTLRTLRKKKGLNQEELAQILGVRKTTISNYETGYSTPSTAMIRKIADYFGVSYEVILGNVPSMAEPTSLQYSSSNVKQIPVYNILSTTESLEPEAMFSISLPLSLTGNHPFFGIKISGDRMDKTQLIDGSIAIIRQQTFADDGDIVIISMGDNPAQINRYHRNGDHVILVPESNNSSHQSIIVDLRVQSVKIYGKIIMVLRTVS